LSDESRIALDFLLGKDAERGLRKDMGTEKIDPRGWSKVSRGILASGFHEEGVKVRKKRLRRTSFAL